MIVDHYSIHTWDYINTYVSKQLGLYTHTLGFRVLGFRTWGSPIGKSQNTGPAQMFEHVEKQCLNVT